ncbi:MAG: type II-A CRISPR-associated protein Csn2 [Clostridiales bacterium]|jgi:CRISPR-associated protein, csn2 family|nr:type II-A CRISPR-associated protein Csn2 [Clostridiales bacterium]
MKIKIKGFENELKLNADDKCYSIQIENKKLYQSILSECINEDDEKQLILIDNKENCCEIEKHILFISDPYNEEVNNKKILTKIYEIISKSINENIELITKIDTNLYKIREIIINEANELPIEFESLDDIKITDILTLFKLKIDTKSYITIVDRINLMIEIMSIIKSDLILCFFNLKSILEKQQIIEIEKYALYHNIKLLLIEPNLYDNIENEITLQINKNFEDEII